MKRFLLSCGHTVDKPPYVCEKCNCSQIVSRIWNKYEKLEGRMAMSCETGKLVKSSWDLPGFKYCPYNIQDLYMTNHIKRKWEIDYREIMKPKM